MSPSHRELITISEKSTGKTAALLHCEEAFVRSWFPRENREGKVEDGWAPSEGFIASALAILRSSELAPAGNTIQHLSPQ